MTQDADDKIKKLGIAAYDYKREHWSNGGSSEFDQSINDISRDLIKAYSEKYGNIFLGKINDYDQHGENPQITFTPYTGQMICNFEYTFVIPCEDEELRQMLTIHNTAKGKYDGKSVKGMIDKIIARILEIGGDFLSWS